MDHSALRREIRNRLERGERPEEIKEEMVSNNYPKDVIEEILEKLEDQDIGNSTKKDREKEDNSRPEREEVQKRSRKEKKKYKEQKKEESKTEKEENSSEHDEDSSGRSSGVSISEALSYPLREDKVKFLGKGGLFNLSTMLLVPVIPLMGYYLKAIRAFSESRRPPEIGGFKELSVLGLKHLGLIMFLTLIMVPFAILNKYAGAAAALIVAISMPAIIYLLATENSIKSALNGGNIAEIISRKIYFVGLLKFLIAGFIVGIINIVSVITVVGPLVASFYGNLVGSAMIAQMCSGDQQ
jgi:hypothetical protein